MNLERVVKELLDAWHDPESKQAFDRAICKLQVIVDYPIQCDSEYIAKLDSEHDEKEQG